MMDRFTAAPRALLALACAAVLLLSSAAAAQAEEITLSPGGAVTFTSDGYFPFLAGSLRWGCQLSITASLVAGAYATPDKIGETSLIRSPLCQSGSRLTILDPRVPHDIQLLKFGSGMYTTSIIDFGFQVTTSGVTCLYRGGLNIDVGFIATVGAFRTYGWTRALLGINALPLQSGSLGCPAFASFSDGWIQLAPDQTFTRTVL